MKLLLLPPFLSRSLPRRFRRVVLAAFGFVFAVQMAFAAPLSVVEGGKSSYVIVVSKDASLPEQHAADELRRYVAKVSGAELPVIHQAGEGQKAIYIGTKHPQLAQGGKKGEHPSHDDGFLVHADDGNIVITSESPRGVLYGTYAFIEKTLGVRWMNPGEDGEYVPKREAVGIESGRWAEDPFFKNRFFTLTCTNINAMLWDTWDWMVRNRMQVKVTYKPFWENSEHGDWLNRRAVLIEGGGHVLASFVPEEVYFKSHPEYFTLIDGKRIAGGHAVDEFGKCYQRCTSNSDVIKLSAGYINSFFSTEPAGDIFGIGNNDGDGWCECGPCTALDHPDEAKEHLVSTRFMHFVNAVTEEVLKAHPEKEIYTWGYQRFRSAPKGVKPHPKVSLFVALHGRCYRHSLDDAKCPANTQMRTILSEWRKFSNPVGVREYYSCFLGGDVRSPVPPYTPLEDVVAKDIKYLASIGCVLWEDETPPPDGVFGSVFDNESVRESWRSRFPMYYVAAKLLWNPELDVEVLKDEVYRAWYGAAYEEMKSYRELISKAWQESDGHFIYGSNAIFIGKSLDAPGRQEECLRLLNAATAKAQDDPKLAKRIAEEKHYFESIWVKMAGELRTTFAWEDVQAHRASGPVSIDGNLSDAAWAKVPVTTGFHTAAGNLAEQQTFVKMLYDKDALVIGMEMMEPTPKAMEVSETQRDGRVWGEDSVELFIDPERSGSSYYHIVFNALGTIYDAACVEGGKMDRAFNGNYEIRTKVLEDRWIAEVRIPFVAFKTEAAEGSAWKMNIGRTRSVKGAAVENSSWTDGRFHQVNSFRTVVFGDRPALLTNGGFEKIGEVNTDADRDFYSVGKWELGNTPAIFPVRWSLHDAHPGKLTLVNDDVHSGKWAAKVERGWIYQGVDVGEGASLKISFWAKGEDSLKAMLFQYRQEAGEVKDFLETVELETFPLQGDWQKYTIEYVLTSPSVNHVAIALDVQGEAILDDVFIEEKQQ